MVVYQQKCKEVLKRIEDEARAKPRDPGMFKHYQVTVKRVMAELDDDKLEKAKATAEEPSNNCPPPEIQAQVARKKGPAYMEHFSSEMWRQCGMRVFVMSAWKNDKGEVLFGMQVNFTHLPGSFISTQSCRHNDNEALGDGDSFMKTKDWENIEPVWQEYAQEQFGECLNCVYWMSSVDPHHDRCRGMGCRKTGQGRSQKNPKASFRTRHGRGWEAIASGHHRHEAGGEESHCEGISHISLS
jgi:hypothetical protein